MSEHSCPDCWGDRHTGPCPEPYGTLNVRFHRLRRVSMDGLGRLYLVEQVGTGQRHLLRVVNRAVTLGGPGETPAIRDREGRPGVRDPHVAAVTEAGETSDGLVYLVMAPCDGTLLADLVQPGTTRIGRASCRERV